MWKKIKEALILVQDIVSKGLWFFIHTHHCWLWIDMLQKHQTFLLVQFNPGGLVSLCLSITYPKQTLSSLFFLLPTPFPYFGSGSPWYLRLSSSYLQLACCQESDRLACSKSVRLYCQLQIAKGQIFQQSQDKIILYIKHSSSTHLRFKGQSVIHLQENPIVLSSKFFLSIFRAQNQNYFSYLIPVTFLTFSNTWLKIHYLGDNQPL